MNILAVAVLSHLVAVIYSEGNSVSLFGSKNSKTV